MRLYSQSSTCMQTIGDENGGGAHAPPRLEAGRGGGTGEGTCIFE